MNRPAKRGNALGELLVECGTFVLAAWAVMLFLGAAHSEDGRIPDLGFWAVAQLLLAARFAWAWAISHRSEL